MRYGIEIKKKHHREVEAVLVLACKCARSEIHETYQPMSWLTNTLNLEAMREARNVAHAHGYVVPRDARMVTFNHTCERD